MFKAIKTTVLFFGICALQHTVQPSDIQTLVIQLNEPATSDRAVGLILRAAMRDAAAKSYVVQRLPEVIESGSSEHVRINAIRLAGELKSASLVQPLVRVLSRSPYHPSVLTFGGAANLDSDPVGKALSQIGEPAVPALAQLMAQETDQENRWRAARILWNIDTPSSRKILHEDLKHESDPRIRAFTDGKSQR